MGLRFKQVGDTWNEPVWCCGIGERQHSRQLRFPRRDGYSMLQNVTKDMLTTLAEMTPIGRLGTPEDVAATVVFLCSDRASLITGGEFAVDGGLDA